MTTTKKTVNAETTFAQLESVVLDSVPVMSNDRHIPRKTQAALSRQLFKSLGVKGLSITTPNYSMASTVDIELPRVAPESHDQNAWPHYHGSCCGQPNGHTEETRCPACRSKANAEKKVESILAIAFPSHDDRSDSISDYFDYCWSVS